MPEQKRKDEMSQTEKWIERRWKRPRLGLDREEEEDVALLRWVAAKRRESEAFYWRAGT